jgi:hypothetical protein
MCLVLIGAGGGALSLDGLLIRNFLMLSVG